jgi:hypothetical protein
MEFFQKVSCGCVQFYLLIIRFAFWYKTDMHPLTQFLTNPYPGHRKKNGKPEADDSGKVNFKVMVREMVLNVKNKRTHKPEVGKVDIYCGRGSVLGNPYTHKEGTTAKYIVESRDEAVEAYRAYFVEQVRFNAEFVNELRRIYRIARKQEVNLVCYCAPLNCHCNVIRAFLLSF